MRNVNWRKRSLALVLSAVTVTGMLAGSALQVRAVEKINVKKWANAPLGQLSAKYETGSRSDPGFYTTVEGDIGGTSYGIYMFARSADTPRAFAQWCLNEAPNVYRFIGDELMDAYNNPSPGYGSNFNSRWGWLGDAYPELFAGAQHDFVQDKIYQALVDKLEAGISGFDIDNYSTALKNVLWSRGVQHGVDGAYNMIIRAFSDMKINDTKVGFAGQSEAELIEAIYARSGAVMDADHMRAETAEFKSGVHQPMAGTTAEKYGVADQYARYYFGNSPDIQLGVYYRLRINEPSDALEMLYDNTNAQFPDGEYVLACGTSYLSGDLRLGAKENACAWHLTYFQGGYYTFTVDTDSGSKRLGVSSGTLSLENPGAGNGQKWKWDKDYGSWYNLGAKKYMVPESNGVTLKNETGEKWALSASGAKSRTYGMYYPGMVDNSVIVEGSSSFPIRGVLTCSAPISKVTVTVTNSNGQNAAGTPKSVNGEYNAVSLEPLDDLITISSLKKGDYTFKITAQVGGNSMNVVETTFRVNDSTGTPVRDDKFQLTFDPNGGTFTHVPDDLTPVSGKNTMIRTVKLGEPYGELPVATMTDKEFVGWFLEDGTQVAANTVAAGNHTLKAQYGELYTYTFYNEDGTTVYKTGKLAKGDNIPNPGNPVKSPDKNYIYNFEYWLMKGTTDTKWNNKTFINATDTDFVAVFSKTKKASDSGNTGGGTGGGGGGSSSGGGGAVSGNYLTGITPGTSVSSLSGYTVYKNGSQVTSGTVGTGMTARSGGTEVTIVVTGDTSGDGKITITDVVKLQSHVVGKATLSGAYAKAADVNRDGKVTITDVVQAAQVTVGKRTIG